MEMLGLLIKDGIYFVASSVVEWMPVFTTQKYLVLQVRVWKQGVQ